MRTNWLCTLTVLLPFLLAPAPSFAQERQFFDAVEVKVASVEVVVEDGNGKKIAGLGVDDFEILEEGVRQQIDYFSAQENGKAVAGLEQDEPVAVAATERVHLAIFLDDVHLSPQNRNQVFDRLRTYLKSSLQPTDLVLIARLSDRLVIEQPFTADAALLMATLDRLETRASQSLQLEANYRRILREVASTALATDDGGEETGRSLKPIGKISPLEMVSMTARGQAREIMSFSEERRMRVIGTINSLRTAIGSLAGMSGRKALIYISDGLPVRAATSLADAWRDKYEDWAINNGLRELLDEISRAASMSIEAESELNNLAKESSSARVAFYVLSPGTSLSRGVGAAELSGSSSGGIGLARAAATTESFEGESPLLQLAEVTGGRARTRNSDIAALFAEVRDDFGTFYSLGYKPKSEAKDGSRKIVVKVRGRPDAKVRYTHHLGDEDPVEQLRELTLSALYHGLTSNPLQIELEPKPAEDLGGDRFRVDVMVKIPFEKLLLLPQEANHVGRLTLFVVVQDHKSHNLSTMSRVELPLSIPNEQILAVMAQKAAYPLKLEMKGGSQRLAIGIRDHLARVSATVEVDLDVPASLAVAAPAPAMPNEPAANPTGGAR